MEKVEDEDRRRGRDVFFAPARFRFGMFLLRLSFTGAGVMQIWASEGGI
jgi:hypothetical protein